MNEGDAVMSTWTKICEDYFQHLCEECIYDDYMR